RPFLNRFRRGVVNNRLIIDRRIMNVGPGRLFEGEPVTIGLEPPLEEEVRLVLLGRDHPYYVFVEPRRRRIALDWGDKAVLVFSIGQLVDSFGLPAHALLRFFSTQTAR